MRKILWEVKSILNKREKHLRGRHDQRDHNRWPAGYQAQTYTPSDRRSRVSQGRASAQSIVAMAPRKVKPVPGAMQTSMFDEGFVATVAPTKPTREQLFQNIRGTSRKMYAKTDEFITDISQRIKNLYKNETIFGLTPNANDSTLFASSIGARLINLARLYNIPLHDKAWHETFNPEEMRLLLQQDGDSKVDFDIEMLQIYADISRYRSELENTSNEIVGWVGQAIEIYNEKYKESEAKMAEAESFYKQKQQERFDFIEKTANTSDNDEEKQIAVEYVSAKKMQSILNDERAALYEKYLEKHNQVKEEMKKDDKERRRRRRADGGTVFLPYKSRFFEAVKEADDAKKELDTLDSDIMDLAIKLTNLDAKFTSLNSEFAKMKKDANDKYQDLENEARDILRDNNESHFYTELFSHLTRENGMENVTIDGVDAKNYPIINERNRVESLVKSIFAMMPKEVFYQEKLGVENKPAYVQDFSLKIYLSGTGRAQFEHGQPGIPSETVNNDGTVKYAGRIRMSSSDAANFSTLSHELVHATQMMMGSAFWMHLYEWIDEKLQIDMYGNPGVQLEKLNKIEKRHNGEIKYESDEVGYDGGKDLGSYLLKSYENPRYSVYTSLREIHTMAITRLLGESSKFNPELLTLFMKAILGMPSKGRDMELMNELFSQVKRLSKNKGII